VVTTVFQFPPRSTLNVFLLHQEGTPKNKPIGQPQNKCSKDLVIILSNILHSKNSMAMQKKKYWKKMDKCPSEKKERKKNNNKDSP
jgi:hypothetical protein